MNNLTNFLQTKESQINGNLSTGEPSEEQLNNFVRVMSDQMYQIVSQAPTSVKTLCVVRFLSNHAFHILFLYVLLF
jgi:hypothetical protein